MKVLIEHIIYSFYITSKKYEYRTGKPIEVSAINYLSFILTCITSEAFIYIFVVLFRYMLLHNIVIISHNGEIVCSLIILLFALPVYLAIKRSYSVEYVKSIFEKYENRITKTKAVLIIISTILFNVLMLMATFWVATITIKHLH